MENSKKVAKNRKRMVKQTIKDQQRKGIYKKKN